MEEGRTKEVEAETSDKEYKNGIHKRLIQMFSKIAAREATDWLTGCIGSIPNDEDTTELRRDQTTEAVNSTKNDKQLIKSKRKGISVFF